MTHSLKKLLPHNLQTRFQFGLAIILLLLCLLSATAIYTHQHRLLVQEALQQTELVMTAIQSTRGYIRETLRPRMYELLPEDGFILEAMSTSYISRVIMERFETDLPDFIYRRVAYNARNSNFDPNPLEKEMIRYFQDHPEQSSWHGIKRHQGKQYFFRFEPVTFKKTCLHCHGAPADAPRNIRTRYGISRGFGHRANETSGVVSVSIPVDSDLAGIRISSFWILIGVAATILLLYLMIWGFFRRLVVTNLHKLLGIFRETINDAPGIDLIQQVASRDEMHELLTGTRLLAEHLRDNRHQLQDYANHLEEMVAERTEELEHSHDKLRSQIQQRNCELQLFTMIAELTTSTDRLETILPSVLQKTLNVVPGRGGAIYLKDSQGRNLLQYQENAGDLPELLVVTPESEVAICPDRKSPIETTCGSINILNDENHTVRIPLCCRNRTHGYLLITGLDPDSVDDSLRDLLLSIGNQIGITIESLQSIGTVRKSEKLLQSVFNGISDPLILFDSLGAIRMVNQAFLAYHDLAPFQTEKYSLRDLITDKSYLLIEIWHLFEPEALKPKSKTVRLENGDIFDVLFYPVPEANGGVESVICFARDVTELKQVEQKISQTEKMVAVGQLAAGVAHEINNPLGVILCYADIIKDESSNSEQIIRDIETIEHHALNCRQIVAALLNFAHSQDHQATRHPTQINEDIRAVVSMVDSQFAKHQIQLDVMLAEDLPRCLIDSDRMQQVLMNLVMNASQAIEKDGRIRIETGRGANGQVLITVEDNGPGIPPEIRSKIFNPFFTTKKPGEGTGLGLSISYSIIADHQGEIQVESTSDHTIFTISLPEYVERT